MLQVSALLVYQEFPLIQPGDDLAEIILASLGKSNLTLQNGDVLIITQKIVSKAENRLVNLTIGQFD